MRAAAGNACDLLIVMGEGEGGPEETAGDGRRMRLVPPVDYSDSIYVSQFAPADASDSLRVTLRSVADAADVMWTDFPHQTSVMD